MSPWHANQAALQLVACYPVQLINSPTRDPSVGLFIDLSKGKLSYYKSKTTSTTANMNFVFCTRSVSEHFITSQAFNITEYFTLSSYKD